MTVKSLCCVLGFILLAVGLAGFRAPDILGLHLSTVHCALAISSGLVSLYFGLLDSNQGARAFARIAGGAYLALGLLGFCAPHLMATLLRLDETTGVDLATDNVAHVIIGVGFLLASAARAGEYRPRPVGENVRRG